MRALLLRKGKKEVDRREGREEEGICRTNVKVSPLDEQMDGRTTPGNIYSSATGGIAFKRCRLITVDV